jgi:hypothetical protein
MSRASDPQISFADVTFIEQGIETRQRAARQTYESLSLELEELRHGLLPQEVRASRWPGPGRAVEPVTGEIDEHRRFYEAIQQYANHARMASVVRQSNIRLIGPAEPAAHPTHAACRAATPNRNWCPAAPPARRSRSIHLSMTVVYGLAVEEAAK